MKTIKAVSTLLIPILLLTGIAPIGVAYADKPVPVHAEADFTATVVDERIEGQTRIREVTQVGTISGSFVGTVDRELTLQTHLKTGKNTVQNILTCTCDIVIDSDVLASGTFVFTMMGLAGTHVQWVIISSDLVDSDGNPVNLHGQGTSTVQFTGIVDFGPPLVYTIHNTYDGQIHFDP